MPLGPWEPHPKYSETEIRRDTETNDTFVTLFPEGRGNSTCWCWVFIDREGGSKRDREEARSEIDKRAIEKLSLAEPVEIKDQESVEEPKVKFSWVALYEIARPEGYRVVIEVPSKALIKIQSEDDDHNPVGKQVTLRLRNNCCFVLAGGSITEELEEGKILATPRPIRPER